MALITYLSRHFLTKNELLSLSKVSEQELVDYQNQTLMPQPSYRLSLSLESDSYFGQYSGAQEIHYYAKGYPSWLSVVALLQSKDSIFSLFKDRYIRSIQKLKAKGIGTNELNNKTDLDNHINNEWEHFLSGTYGLCTKTGLSEDIAAKELAIRQIETLCQLAYLDKEQTAKLTVAVNLLDEVSALFAPHERSRSSRERLINQVRRQYAI